MLRIKIAPPKLKWSVDGQDDGFGPVAIPFDSRAIPLVADDRFAVCVAEDL